MEQGEFHETSGWTFKRLEDGSVRIRKYHPNGEGEGYIEHIVPANGWVSILAEVSRAGGTPLGHALAEDLHVG